MSLDTHHVGSISAKQVILMALCLLLLCSTAQGLTEGNTANKVNFWVGWLNEKNVGKDNLDYEADTEIW